MRRSRRMASARVRLVLAAVLFVLWIGWLAYLAWTTTRAVRLSRPQLLVSTLDVRARVEAQPAGRPLPEVTVLEVFYSPQAGPNPGDKLTVTNLDECVGWEGPGEYLLPLVKA